MGQKQRVLKLIREGCRTSYEVSACTRMSVKTVSAHLSVLREAGKIREVGRVPFDKRGHETREYEPVSSRSADAAKRI